MSAKDYLDVPNEIINIINIKLPKKAENEYKKLEKELVLELENEDITASNSAVLTNKLLQMSNGAIYSEDHNVIEIHDEKLKALVEIIDTANGKPILVFYNFKHDYDRIVSYLNSKKIQPKGLKDQEDIKDWNKGNVPVLLVHPASAGHGLNLQYGGSIIVWFGLTWSLELYQQANARLHRQGQKEHVVINHLVTTNTVDNDVMQALEGKEVNQNILLEAVKARIREMS